MGNTIDFGNDNTLNLGYDPTLVVPDDTSSTATIDEMNRPNSIEQLYDYITRPATINQEVASRIPEFKESLNNVMREHNSDIEQLGIQALEGASVVPAGIARVIGDVIPGDDFIEDYAKNQAARIQATREWERENDKFPASMVGEIGATMLFPISNKASLLKTARDTAALGAISRAGTGQPYEDIIHSIPVDATIGGAIHGGIETGKALANGIKGGYNILNSLYGMFKNPSDMLKYKTLDELPKYIRET